MRVLTRPDENLQYYFLTLLTESSYNVEARIMDLQTVPKYDIQKKQKIVHRQCVQKETRHYSLYTDVHRASRIPTARSRESIRGSTFNNFADLMAGC